MSDMKFQAATVAGLSKLSRAQKRFRQNGMKMQRACTPTKNAALRQNPVSLPPFVCDPSLLLAQVDQINVLGGAQLTPVAAE